ncbi:MAG: hypothetical protein ABIZ34_03010 [Candidatus Limnocylindrales bacterium]
MAIHLAAVAALREFGVVRLTANHILEHFPSLVDLHHPVSRDVTIVVIGVIPLGEAAVHDADDLGLGMRIDLKDLIEGPAAVHCDGS